MIGGCSFNPNRRPGRFGDAAGSSDAGGWARLMSAPEGLRLVRIQAPPS